MNRLSIGTLIVVGLALVAAWAVGVFAYGYEVDEQGLVGTVRAQDVALFAGGVACLACAGVVLVVQRRRLKSNVD